LENGLICFIRLAPLPLFAQTPAKRRGFCVKMFQVLLFILYLAVAVGVVYLIGAAIKNIFNGR